MRTRILASVTLWLAAVASVAAIAWLAIDAAGRQVTASPISASVRARPDPTSTGPTAPATTVPPTSASPRLSGSPTGTAPPSTPTATRGPTATVTLGGSGPRSVAPVVVSGSYSTTGGRVRVNCRGRMIGLDGGYAQPAPGWSVRVQSGGPWQVQVIFELNDQQALLVLATCADGRPQFDQDRIEAGSPPSPH